MSALGAHTTLLRLGGCRQLLQRASTTGSLSQITERGFLVGVSEAKASKAESCAERLLGRNALFGSSGAHLLRQSGICSVGFRGMVSVPILHRGLALVSLLVSTITIVLIGALFDSTHSFLGIRSHTELVIPSESKLARSGVCLR
jgi:hypothetical protein